jgi:hypothetical protein
VTHHWLSDVHEDQMLDLLQTEIKFDATSPPVIIENMEFFCALRSAYEQQNTNYETSRPFKHLCHIGIVLRNGTYKQLAYMMNVKNSHWVVISLDFDDHYKGNLTDLRRILHLSLAKGNPKEIYKSSKTNTQHLPSQGKSKENTLRTPG